MAPVEAVAPIAPQGRSKRSAKNESTDMDRDPAGRRERRTGGNRSLRRPCQSEPATARAGLTGLLHAPSRPMIYVPQRHSPSSSTRTYCTYEGTLVYGSTECKHRCSSQIHVGNLRLPSGSVTGTSSSTRSPPWPCRPHVEHHSSFATCATTPISIFISCTVNSSSAFVVLVHKYRSTRYFRTSVVDHHSDDFINTLCRSHGGLIASNRCSNLKHRQTFDVRRCSTTMSQHRHSSRPSSDMERRIHS